VEEEKEEEEDKEEDAADEHSLPVYRGFHRGGLNIPLPRPKRHCRQL